MDARRLQYLKALDIDVWRRREGAEPLVAATSAGGLATPGAETATATAPAAALDWTALEAAVRGCTRCGLSQSRTQTVFGVGDRTAQWMVIGEAPGGDEDREGEPFVGRAGQLLTSMLKAMGLGREQVFIANILKCRPPGNRDPDPEEVAHCMPYLQQQIELVNPRLILCVGRIAAQNLLKTDTPIGKLRGQLHRLPGTERAGRRHLSPGLPVAQPRGEAQGLARPRVRHERG